ncbi:Insulinase (Peptidase M16) [Phlyctochytrium planicorne]|nr:Insulinase (Peptidase M16) [Phlyctochytrium planicorne]
MVPHQTHTTASASASTTSTQAQVLLNPQTSSSASITTTEASHDCRPNVPHNPIPLPPNGSGETEEQTHTIFSDIRKPDLDDRTYRLISLPNGLDALVVSDPTTDRSSAALDVHVGFFSDPEEVMGLAHFLEHLLFLGTEKYPVENDYSQFLSEVGGGYSNAYTSNEHTNYFFEVASEGEAFEGALDRFAQFFISPLFDESCTERELKAVDSEHKKNIQDDVWRLSQLDKDLSSRDHPYRKFGTGSWETLHEIPLQKGMDIRKILLEFHDRYYSANIMKLVVLGKEDIATLSSWVVSKFSAVHNKNIPVPTFSGHPYTPSDLQKLIKVKPVKDMQSLEITFPFPDTVPHYRKSPDSYLSHLLGHEGKGSVLALLKGKGWANGLAAYVSHAGIGFDFFKVSVELTDEGMDNWEDIVVIVFQYILMLKRCGVQEWIYDEVSAGMSVLGLMIPKCKTMAQMTFRFQEKFSPSDFTSWASQNMQTYTKSDILSGYSLMEEFDESLIKGLLDHLSVDKFRVMLVSNFEGDAWEKAEWYGTEYRVEDLPEDLLWRLREVEEHESLHLPDKNPYIPEVFDVVKPLEGEDLSSPVIIQDTPIHRLWYKLDQTYKVPKTHIALFIRTTNSYSCPRSSVLNRLFVDLVMDSLNEEAYNAELGGLYHSISTLVEGFEVRVAGYTDKLKVLLGKVVGTMRGLDIAPERFNALHEVIVRSYKNFDNENPDHHASYFVNWIIQEKLWTNAEKLQEVHSITPSEVSDYARKALQQLHIEAFVMGTVSENEAKSYIKIVEDGLSGDTPIRPLPITLRFQLMRTHIIPYPSIFSSHSSEVESLHSHSSFTMQNCSFGPTAPLATHQKTITGYTYRRLLPNQDNVNNALEYYLQIGDATDPDLRAYLLLFDQMSSEPCFDQLRTKEQLGYTRNVETMATKLLQTDKNQNDAVERLWSAIKYSGYQFYQGHKDAVRVRSVTQKSLVVFFDERIRKGGKLRRKLSVQIWSHHSKEEWSKTQDATSVVVLEGEEQKKDDPAVVAEQQTPHVVPQQVDSLATAAVDKDLPPVPDAGSETAVSSADTSVSDDPKNSSSLAPEPIDLIFETDEAVSELKGSWLLSRGLVPTAAYSHLAKAVTLASS